MNESIGSFSGALLGGAYRIGGLIGRGGMGAVYAATQESLGRRVAVKILHAHLAEDPNLVDRFRREAEAAAALGHPNIVQVTDFQQRAGEPAFLVMEFLVGCSLGAAIDATGGLAPGRAAFVVSQVLSALSAAHGAGIIHRDLKPDNVFLTSISGVADIVKLLDFGIAKLALVDTGAGRTATGSVLGTPAYMAPEQARGEAVDARADLYAAGAVAYQTLTGRLPFEATNYNAMLIASLEGTATPIRELRPEVPPLLAAVVERAMRKRPDERFQSAAEMHAALLPFVQASVGAAPMWAPPTDVSPPNVPTNPLATTLISTTRPGSLRGVTASAKRSPLRVPLVWLGALAIVAGIVVAVVTVDWTTSPEPEPGAPSASPSTEAASPASFVRDPPTAAAVAQGALDAGALDAGALDAGALDAGAPSPRVGFAPVVREGGGNRRRPRPVPKRAPMSGARPYLSSMTMNSVYSIPHARALVTARMADIARCFVAARFEPPEHQFPYYRVSVAPSGAVTSVAPPGTDARCPRIDRCVARVFRAIPWGPTQAAEAGYFDLGFTARIRD